MAHVRSDEGMTLVEVLVTIVIGMVVLFAALQFLDLVGPSSVKVQDRADAAQRARITMDRLTTVLQAQVCNGTESPITYASASEIVFTANTGSKTSPPRGYHIGAFGSGSSGTISLNSYTLGTPSNGFYPWITSPTTGSGTGHIFKYVVWEAPSDTDPSQDQIEIDPGNGVLTADERKRIVEVVVDFTTFPQYAGPNAPTRAEISASGVVSSGIQLNKLHLGPQCS